MNWQDVKWPIEVDCGQCDEFGWDNWSFLEADGEDTGERLIITEVQMAEIANALHAEVERLKKTQRKLVRIARDLSYALECVVGTIKNEQLPSADEEVALAFRLGQAMEMLNGDSDVRAAIKEASDEA